jgi:secondary thiamine-phosphate synthase enzyme
MENQRLIIETQAKSLINITSNIQNMMRGLDLESGLCHLFCQHTSCSFIISENADADVLYDLNAYMSSLVPESGAYKHRAEGRDDMPSHIRCVFTSTSISIPYWDGELMLGRWQAIYLWEHRDRSFKRSIIVSL